MAMSGAQKRKLQKLTQIEKTLGAQRTPEDVLQRYLDLGPPPIEEPVGVIAWANKVGALLLWEVLTDKTISVSERRRVAGEMIAKIGLTHSKAKQDQTLADIKKKLESAQKSQEIDHDLEEPITPDGD